MEQPPPTQSVRPRRIRRSCVAGLRFLVAGWILAACHLSEWLRGGVLELDGHGSYVELPERLGEDLQEFTIELRVRWDHLGYYDSPLHFGDKSHAIAFNHQSLGFQTPVAFVQPGSLAPVKATGSGLLTPGRWAHLAATVTPRGIRLYFNGVCVATNNTPIPPGVLGAAPFRWLGRSPWEDNGYFRGGLDDVCLWGRVLTDEELRRRPHTSLTGDEAGLVAAWTFEAEEGSGDGRVSWSVGRNRLAARLRSQARVVPGDASANESYPMPASLDGVVESNVGPIHAGDVRLWRGGRLVGEAILGAGGLFHMDIVPSMETCELEVLAGEFGAWEAVQLNPGERRALRLLLRPCRSVVGRVVTMNGIPQAGVEISAIRLDSTSSPGRERELAAVRTDLSGRFEFLNLRSGRYRLVCPVSVDALPGNRGADPEILCNVEAGRVETVPDFRLPRLHSGHRWRRFGKDEGLPDLRVNAIEPDAAGNVWFGTQGGLSRFDGATVKTWRREDGLPANSVSALAMDSQQTLWIGTEDGLVALRDGRMVGTPTPGAPDRAITSIAVGSDRSLWVAAHSGLFLWNGRQWARFGPEDGLPSRLVRHLKAYPDGTLTAWTDGGVVVWRNGRFEVQGAGDPFVGLPAPETGWEQSRRFTLGFHPSDWRTTPAGETWAIAGGLYHHNGRRWSRSQLGEEGSWDEIVGAMSRDHRGTIWLGTLGKGAWYRVEDRVTQFTEEDGLPGRVVHATARGADGSLWIGVNGGVARLRSGELQAWTPVDGLPFRRVRSLLVDRSGRLWLGTDVGVAWFDGEEFVLVPNSPRIEIRSLSEGPDGSVWIATAGDGIHRWTPREGISRFGAERGIWEGHLNSIHAAQNGFIWYAQDLYVARIEPDRVVHTVVTASGDPGPGRDHSSRIISYAGGTTDDRLTTVTLSLAEARDGTLWTGTYAQGLLRYRDGVWTHFPSSPDAPFGAILSVHVAPDGRLWCGTLSGAFVFDGDLWGLIDKRDGLAGNEVSSIRSDPDGTLWFGTDQGLTRYVPLRRATKVDLSVVEASELSTGSDGILTVLAGERITLNAAAEPTSQVRWRTVGPRGGAGSWTALDTSFSRTWRAETPGLYSLEVMSVDRDLNRSKPARLEIRVRQPWFRNAWALTSFWTGGGALLMATTFLGIRNRRIRAETERLRREAADGAEQERLRGQFARELINTQEAERRRLAGELHDSLGQELLLIRNTALLAAQAGRDGLSNGPLEEIAERASRTIQEVRSIAYALRPQELDRLGLIRALRTLCEEMTEAAGLELVFETDPIRGQLGSDAEIALYRAVQEGLSNVVRHAKARRVEFGILEMGGQVVARLRDDGVGFSPPPDSADRSGLGLVGMSERMRLVGGTCSVSSVTSSGTEVEFRIPLRKSNPVSSSNLAS